MVSKKKSQANNPLLELQQVNKIYRMAENLATKAVEDYITALGAVFDGIGEHGDRLASATSND